MDFFLYVSNQSKWLCFKWQITLLNGTFLSCHWNLLNRISVFGNEDSEIERLLYHSMDKSKINMQKKKKIFLVSDQLNCILNRSTWLYSNFKLLYTFTLYFCIINLWIINQIIKNEILQYEKKQFITIFKASLF